MKTQKHLIDSSKIEIKQISNAYLVAKQFIIKEGFEYEIDWQTTTRQLTLTENLFLRETAWVVLSSGMSEFVIRSIFPAITSAFLDWKSAVEIISCTTECRENALHKFRNQKKIDAIIKIASHVAENSFEFVLDSIQKKGVEYISQFPFMGPATSYHLAKNIGIDVAKPDRHLIRIATMFGYSNVQHFCSTISEYVGDDIAEVDLVLWRYATLNKNYLTALNQKAISE